MSSDALERAVNRALKEAEAAIAKPQTASPDASDLGQNLPAGVQAIQDSGPRGGSESKVSPARTDFKQLHLDEAVLAKNHIVGHDDDGAEVNLFKMLRSRVLYKLRSNKCRSLAIIGPQQGVGKTFVAINFSLTLARQKNLEVALVDLDLRQPSVARTLGVKTEYSMADYLEENCELEEVAFTTQFPNLTIYAGHRPSVHAAELLTTPRAVNLVQRLTRNPGTLVVVDLPPACGLPDVETFLPTCDAGLLVTGYASTTKKQIEETIGVLGDTPLVGYLVNRSVKKTSSSYGYGYGAESQATADRSK